MAPSLGLLVLAVPTRTCDVGCILSEEGRKDSAGSTCQGLSSSAQRSSLPRCPMGDSPHASWLSSAKGLGRGMFLDSTAIILCEERALWSNAKHWHKPSYVDAFVCLPACSATSVVFNPASLPASSVHGILQARMLEWVTMPSSGGSSRSRNRTHTSCSSCVAGRFFTAEPLCLLQVFSEPLRVCSFVLRL